MEISCETSSVLILCIFTKLNANIPFMFFLQLIPAFLEVEEVSLFNA